MSRVRCMGFFLCALMMALVMNPVTPDAACADGTDIIDGERSALRVLYVGPNPEDVHASVSSTMFHYERSEETYANHAPAFEALLKEHFETVRVVYGEDYAVAMSDDYDVTIFDARFDERLPFGWNRASIFIGYAGPTLLAGNQVKLDWL